MYESTLESKLRDYVKLRGGRAFKWVCPGLRGVPDRIVILPGGIVIFVELKRPDVADGLSIRQKKVRALLESLGCTVWRINNLEDFKRRLSQYDL